MLILGRCWRNLCEVSMDSLRSSVTAVRYPSGHGQRVGPPFHFYPHDMLTSYAQTRDCPMQEPYYSKAYDYGPTPRG